MATSPQPPRSPIPPPPPRTSSHIVPIVLLILALIILVSVITVMTGFRFLSRTVQIHVDGGGDGKKAVSIKTPVGSLEVHKDANEAGLGLPIYPGAKRLKDEGAATVSIDLPGEQNVRVVAAKFETSDALEKVKDFYRERLGGEVTKFTEKNSEGKTVFEIERGDQEKVVGLKSVAAGTHIELVHVSHGREASN